jgi:hypothetical protein
MRRSAALLLCSLVLTGCGESAVTTVSLPAATGQPPASDVPSRTPSPTPDPIPSFSTPEAAMRFLADAWNRRDLVALKRVTNPVAREALEFMRHEAINLRLEHCDYNGDRKDYDCSFTHDFPADYKGHDHGASYKQAEVPGTATFVVGPASRSGWYMTVLADCG